jgi:hypothetical protein
MNLKENFKLRTFIRETIRKIGDEYVVYPKRGGKRLGTHSTKAAAEKQVTAIHLNNEIISPPDGVYRDPWLFSQMHKDKVDPKELKMGIKVEMEHTDDPEEAKIIALQHLAEDPKYYTKLKKVGLEMLNYPNWLRFQAQTPGNFPDGEHRFRLPKKKKLKETAGIMTAAEKVKHEKNMLRLRKILNKQPNSYIPYPDIPNTLQRKLHDKSLPEASYEGNMGFEEMMKFHRIATEKQVELLNKLIDQDKIKEAWKLVQKVVGTKLVGKEFNEQTVYQPTVASLAKRHNRTESTIRIALKKGIETELTYVNNVLPAREIALDNLYDDPDYYSKISQLNV